MNLEVDVDVDRARQVVRIDYLSSCLAGRLAG